MSFQTDRLQPLADAPADLFRGVRFVLTDMDETLTHRGRLSARTYHALERLQETGIKVIPVTAASAGWCDQMARMWPVDGVIGENGGLFFQRDSGSRGHGQVRRFWHGDEVQGPVKTRLDAMAQRVMTMVPDAVLSEDQPFRLTSIAFRQPPGATGPQAIADALHAAGADVTVNNLWVLGWLGGYNKLAMARRVLAEVYGVDIDHPGDGGRDAVAYSGDSTNDGPMFAHFHHSVGVSTVRQYLDSLPVPPNWITQGPGGDGFVELADAVIAARG